MINIKSASEGVSTASKSSKQEIKSPYVFLFIILLIAAAATWIIPAGVFDREMRDGISFVVNGSLHAVPQNGVHPLGKV